MELLAGEPKFDVEVVQSGCRFRFDFSKVYWNSRLQAEHDRIVELVFGENGKAAIVADVFSGVGPFSVPLAKKGCMVYANDLNPECYKALNANALLNKVPVARLQTSMKEGSIFLKNLFVHPTNIIMNLPSTAIDTLQVFRRLYLPEDLLLPTIHCYSFDEESEHTSSRIQASIERSLGTSLTSPPSIHLVRTVSPKKSMFCTTFKLPSSIERRHPSVPSL